VKKSLFLTQASVIAAMYVALSYVTNLIPGSLNYFGFRLSEALTVLPAFTPAAIPGLFAGCILTNLLSPMGLPDLIFGSMATLIAALITYKFRKYKWFAPIPPVIVNAIIVGIMLHITGVITNIVSGLFLTILYVAAGQVIVCCGLGYPLMSILSRVRSRIY
jgi:uncharacterized membrane protein